MHWLRREASTVLNMPEARIRCVALDVGGGFGVKGHVYPEELLIPFLARALKRPVRWIEDRHEHFMSACHSRDQIHDVEAGFDDDGRLLAFRDSFIADCGAWNPIGAGIAYNTAVHLPGPYKFDNFAVHARIAATNKVPNAPYRGAGRPEAYIRDGADDGPHCRRAGARSGRCAAAQHDPAQTRCPIALGIPYRDGEAIVYDSGDYPKAPATGARRRSAASRRSARGRRKARARRSLSRPRPRLLCRGHRRRPVRERHRAHRSDRQGLCRRPAPARRARAWRRSSRRWSPTPGRSRRTTSLWSLADTSAISIGFGTIASRSTVTLSSAIHYASEILREKAFAIAANMLECAPSDLELRNGSIGVVGVPGIEVTLASVAKAARPGWDHGRPRGMQAGLEETYYYEPPTVTWSYASHAAIVEVDIRTGRLSIEKYVVAHDCGVVVNPMLVEGPDSSAAPCRDWAARCWRSSPMTPKASSSPARSWIICCRPRAISLHVELIHQHSPSPLNPLGVKGVGEGSAISPPVVIANAGVRCAGAIQDGIQLDAHQARADRRGDAVGAALITCGCLRFVFLELELCPNAHDQIAANKPWRARQPARRRSAASWCAQP